MYWPDYRHYSSKLDTAISEPTASNTLFWVGRTPTAISLERSVSVAYSDLSAELQQKSAVQILFIGSHFTVADMPEAVQKRLNDFTHPRHCEFFVLNPVWPQT
jgi:hypothetical protein